MFTWHRSGSVTVAMVRSHKLHCYKTLQCVAVATFSITLEKDPRVVGDPGKIKEDDIQNAIQFVKINNETILATWRGDLRGGHLRHSGMASRA